MAFKDGKRVVRKKGTYIGSAKKRKSIANLKKAKEKESSRINKAKSNLKRRMANDVGPKVKDTGNVDSYSRDNFIPGKIGKTTYKRNEPRYVGDLGNAYTETNYIASKQPTKTKSKNFNDKKSSGARSLLGSTKKPKKDTYTDAILRKNTTTTTNSTTTTTNSNDKQDALVRVIKGGVSLVSKVRQSTKDYDKTDSRLNKFKVDAMKLQGEEKKADRAKRMKAYKKTLAAFVAWGKRNQEKNASK